MSRYPTVEKIRRRVRLVVGGSATSLLLAARNPISGRIQGFDVDLARQVAKAIWPGWRRRTRTPRSSATRSPVSRTASAPPPTPRTWSATSTPFSPRRSPTAPGKPHTTAGWRPRSARHQHRPPRSTDADADRVQVEIHHRDTRAHGVRPHEVSVLGAFSPTVTTIPSNAGRKTSVNPATASGQHR